MPKKAKQKAPLDPEKQKEIFEQWKLSKEARIWDELVEIVCETKDVENRDAEGIEDDFTLPFKLFLVRLQQLCDEMKVPKRLKSNFKVTTHNRANGSSSASNLLFPEQKTSLYLQRSRR